MSKIKNLSYLFLLMLGFTTSCVPLKNYLYVQDAETKLQQATFAVPEKYKIQTNDNLYIQVITDNPEISAFFNISSSNQNMTSEAAIELSSYRVNDDGDIVLPIVGNINVVGKNIDEIKDLVQTEIAKQVERPSVLVKLVNRTCTILGEVSKPGTFSINKDRISMFEALGYAGDLSDFGDRRTVKLIRHHGTEKKVVNIDLTSADFITSEYYYIMPNDVIYVEPTSRVLGAKTLPFATILTSVNTIVLLYNAIKNF